MYMYTHTHIILVSKKLKHTRGPAMAGRRCSLTAPVLEERRLGESHQCVQTPEGRVPRKWNQDFLRAPRDRTGGNGHTPKHRRCCLSTQDVPAWEVWLEKRFLPTSSTPGFCDIINTGHRLKCSLAKMGIRWALMAQLQQEKQGNHSAAWSYLWSQKSQLPFPFFWTVKPNTFFIILTEWEKS